MGAFFDGRCQDRAGVGKARAEKRSAAMVFNPVAEINPEMYTYWLPTRAALEGMMRMASFEVVATRTINRLLRITVLGRAVKPAAVSQRSALLQKMHDMGFCDHEFRLKQLFAESRAASSITRQPSIQKPS